jgi:hypothetical protein
MGNDIVALGFAAALLYAASPGAAVVTGTANVQADPLLMRFNSLGNASALLQYEMVADVPKHFDVSSVSCVSESSDSEPTC